MMAPDHSMTGTTSNTYLQYLMGNDSYSMRRPRITPRALSMLNPIKIWMLIARKHSVNPPHPACLPSLIPTPAMPSSPVSSLPHVLFCFHASNSPKYHLAHWLPFHFFQTGLPCCLPMLSILVLVLVFVFVLFLLVRLTLLILLFLLIL